MGVGRGETDENMAAEGWWWFMRGGIDVGVVHGGVCATCMGCNDRGFIAAPVHHQNHPLSSAVNLSRVILAAGECQAGVAQCQCYAAHVCIWCATSLLCLLAAGWCEAWAAQRECYYTSAGILWCLMLPSIVVCLVPVCCRLVPSLDCMLLNIVLTCVFP
jgi:hypothetical protein